MLKHLSVSRTFFAFNIRFLSFQTSNTQFIFHGDSQLSKSYEFLDEKCDILFTDPPYCLLERRRKTGELRDQKTSKLNDPTVPRFANVKSYYQFTRTWLQLALTHGLTENSDLIIWTNALGKQPILQAAKEFDYTLRGEFLWVKPSQLTTPQINSTKSEILLRLYESALILQKTCKINSLIPPSPSDPPIPWSVVTGYHDPIPLPSSSPSSTSSSPTHTPPFSFLPHAHPCHKPFSALEPLVRQWIPPGGRVLDPFVGSGALLLACLKVGGGRTGRGIEVLSEWARESEKLMRAENEIR